MQEILFTQLHIMRDSNHRRSLGDCFVKKDVIFQSFSSVTMNFFSSNRNNLVYGSSSPKNSKSLMLQVAKVLKLTLFSVRSLTSLTPAFSQIFSVIPLFLKILTTGTKGGIIPKSERNLEVRD